MNHTMYQNIFPPDSSLYSGGPLFVVVDVIIMDYGGLPLCFAGVDLIFHGSSGVHSKKRRRRQKEITHVHES